MSATTDDNNNFKGKKKSNIPNRNLNEKSSDDFHHRRHYDKNHHLRGNNSNQKETDDHKRGRDFNEKRQNVYDNDSMERKNYRKVEANKNDEFLDAQKKRDFSHKKYKDIDNIESSNFKARRNPSKEDNDASNEYKARKNHSKEDNDVPNEYRARRNFGTKERDGEGRFEFKYREKKYHGKKERDDDDDNDFQYKRIRKNTYSKQEDLNDDEIIDEVHNRGEKKDHRQKNKFNDDHKIAKFNFRKENFCNSEVSHDFTEKIQVKEFSISDFFTALVNAYIYNPKYDDLFTSSKGSKFEISIMNDQTILSYSPKSEKATKLMKKAILCAEMLMPYTPKSILYHNNYPNCAIEVTVNGCTNYETTLHLISKSNINLPKVFNLNDEIIEFLCTKVNELSSSMNLYRIALTGEALSFSLDDNHQEIKYKKISNSNCPTVFGKLFDDKNRLIVLITPGESLPPKQKELDWQIFNLTSQEELIQTAASLAKGLVRAYHAHDLFVIKESPAFTYTGPFNLPEKLGLGVNSTIGQICEYLFKEFTRGTFLAKEIPIKNLIYNENNENVDLNQIETELNNLFIKVKKYNFNQLKKEKDQLFNELGRNPNGERKLAIGNSLTTVKNKINEFHSINKRIDTLKEKKKKCIENKSNDINIKQSIVEKIEQEGLNGRLIQLFGCNVFTSSEPILNKNESEKIEQTLLKIERDLKINAFCVEKLVSATVVVSHRSTSPFSPDQFKSIIEKVCLKFSFVVSFCSNYVRQEKQRGQVGVVFVEVIDPQFSIVVVSEIKRALLGEQVSILRIPPRIASNMMLKEKRNQIAIEKWIQNNGLNSIKFNGENWTGTKDDVSKAYRLLSKSDTCLNFSEKVILLSSFVNQGEIKKLAMKKNWMYDHLSNCIVVDESEQKEAINEIAKLNQKRVIKRASSNDDEDDELIGCIYVCEDQIPSEFPLTIYDKDGSSKTNFLCTECVTSILDSVTERFFDASNGIIFDEVMSSINLVGSLSLSTDDLDSKSDSYWPKLPIGQILWNLVNDQIFSEKAKSWLTAILAQSLHVHPECVTFCPEHPQIILPLPKANETLHCSIRSCPMVLCPVCNEWHREGDCKNYAWEGMRCPGCGKPTVKDVGCNHITCLCGAHWCYKCGAGPFKTAKECYTHMSKDHNGYFN